MTTWQLFISQAQGQRMIRCDFFKCSNEFPYDKSRPGKRFCCKAHQEAQRGRERRMDKRISEERRTGASE